MPQYVVTARDGGDAGAPARRMAARPLHLEKIGPMVADGRIILGGALLDDAGLMIGSVLVVEFADRAGVDAWLANKLNIGLDYQTMNGKLDSKSLASVVVRFPFTNDLAAQIGYANAAGGGFSGSSSFRPFIGVNYGVWKQNNGCPPQP